MTAAHWSVRDARIEEIDLLAGWACAMALETEGKALDRATVQAGIRAGLHDPQRARYLVAMRRVQLAGAETIDIPAATLMLTTEWSDWRNGMWWWIQSVYVAPEHRRHGAYRALHAHVECEARRTEGVIGLRLYVERDNANAQATYADAGMSDAGYRVYEHPFR